MKPTELCLFTVKLQPSICSHVMLDLSPSLQVCDLLAYNCHSCALKSCTIEGLRDAKGKKKAQKSDPEGSICMKWNKEKRPPSDY